MEQVEWIKGDALAPETWKDAFHAGDYTAVVGSIGAFGDNAFMEKMNGDCNIAAVEQAAASSTVGRVVFVSVHQYQFPSWLLSGYFNGKRRAEAAAVAAFPDSSVILQPGMVYGTRHLPDSDKTIPLTLVGRPLEVLLNMLSPLASVLNAVPIVGSGVASIMAPPIQVDVLADAAISTALPSSTVTGVLDVASIHQNASA
jgi:hypothetical protein